MKLSPALLVLFALAAGATANAAAIGTHVLGAPRLEQTVSGQAAKSRTGCNYLRGFKRRYKSTYC